MMCMFTMTCENFTPEGDYSECKFADHISTSEKPPCFHVGGESE